MSRAFITLFQREVKRFIRVLGQTILSPMINSLLYLLIFGVSLGQFVDVGIGVPYLLYLIPGLVMMGVLNNAFLNSASSIMISKYHGDLEDLKVTPMGPHQVVWAMSLASLARGVIVGLSIFFTGEIFVRIQTGSFYAVEHPFWALYFLGIGGLAFGQIGLCVGFVARTFDHMNSFSAFILVPLIYLGGVFFRLENLHPFWQDVSRANPLLYYINGIRYSLISLSDVSVTTCALVGTTFLAFCTLLAYLAVRKGTYQRF